MAVEEITTDRLQDLKRKPKRVTNPKAQWRTEEKYKRRDYEVTAQEGELKFRIYMRQSLADPDDFSCGIRWVMPSGETLTLARYNGPSHIHHEIRFQCHIHRATEEAIRQGRKPEHDAEATERYRTLAGALYCLLQDFQISGLESSPDQPELF